MIPRSENFCSNSNSNSLADQINFAKTNIPTEYDELFSLNGYQYSPTVVLGTSGAGFSIYAKHMFTTNVLYHLCLNYGNIEITFLKI